MWLLAPAQPAKRQKKQQPQQQQPTAAAAAAAAAEPADKPAQLEYTGPWMIQRRVTPDTVLVSKLVHPAGPPGSSSSSSSKSKRVKTITATVEISQLKPYKAGQRAPVPPAAVERGGPAFYVRYDNWRVTFGASPLSLFLVFLLLSCCCSA